MRSRFARIIAYLLNAVLPESWMRAVFAALVEREERVGNCWLTYHERPKATGKIVSRAPIIPDLPDTVFVLQGPIVSEDSLTIETVRMYRRLFPDIRVLVSTWMGVDSGTRRQLAACGAELLENRQPSHGGISNINYQLVSSAGGIRWARERGATHVLKTRTDQRMFANGVPGFLHGLLRAFPLGQLSGQRERLVGISLNTFKYRPYSLSDMFLFGHIDDMELYWSAPLDTRVDHPPVRSIGEWSRMRMCEVYLMSHFLEQVGRPQAWTIADSWALLAERFCIIDASSVDLFWPKYERNREWRYADYTHLRTNEELTYRDWLLLTSTKQESLVVPENIANLAFGAAVPE